MERKRETLEYEKLKVYENYCQGQITMDDYEKIKKVKANQ